MPEYGIPNIMTADGPAGLRIEKKCGVVTTAWPCATLLACTWNPDVLYQVGAAGAAEVKENNIAVWLTPAVNIHRSPLLSLIHIWFAENEKIQAVLMAWQGGMEGGSAAAELLCGVGSPSGKLSDTFAKKLEDYPSSETFHESVKYVDYKEDIYVGYRYFETIPGACLLYTSHTQI